MGQFWTSNSHFLVLWKERKLTKRGRNWRLFKNLKWRWLALTCWFFSVLSRDLIVSARWNWRAKEIRSDSGSGLTVAGSGLEPVSSGLRSASSPAKHGRSLSMAVRTLGWTMIGSGGDDVKFSVDTFERFSFDASASLTSLPSSIEPLAMKKRNDYSKL